jgi:3-deoxy-D-manno-octulosonic-acid transferase
VQQLRSQLQSSGAGPVLVFGSTVEGEEEPLLDAFKAVRANYAQAVLLLAPRHPERFDPVARVAGNLSFEPHRRSSWNGEPLSGSVLLIDTIGELASLYSLADVAFVGGSLVPRGGHSILEPAQYGVPILVGLHTENFRDIIELFRNNDAVRMVTRENVAATLLQLLANASEREALGRRALETLQSQRGATDFTLEKLRFLIATKVHEAHSA